MDSGFFLHVSHWTLLTLEGRKLSLTIYREVTSWCVHSFSKKEVHALSPELLAKQLQSMDGSSVPLLYHGHSWSDKGLNSRLGHHSLGSGRGEASKKGGVTSISLEIQALVTSHQVFQFQDQLSIH